MPKFRSMRSVLILFLCGVLTLSVLSGITPARATNTYYEDYYDDYFVFEYEVLPDGTCAITCCRGSEYDAVYGDVTAPAEIDGYPVSKIDGWGIDCHRLTIPQGVTVICEDAMMNNSFTQVFLPDTLKEIEAGAFHGCDNLTEIQIPNSVESIGSCAFELCDALATVTIGSGVKVMGDEIFYSCDNLTKVTFSDGITKIGNAMFQYCHRLSELTLPNTLTEIGSSAFDCCCSLTSLNLPKGVTRIGEYAFASCNSLEKVTIPWTVTTIECEAFGDCDKLKDIIFQGSPPDIHEDAFMFNWSRGYYPANDPYWTEFTEKFTENIDWIANPVTPSGQILTGNITTFSDAEPTVELLYSSYYTHAATPWVSNGRYRFESVPRGTYVLKISTDNGVTRDYPLEIRFWCMGQDLQINPIGDTTGDGIVNIADAARAYAHVRTPDEVFAPYAFKCADINGDSKVNVLDVSKIYSHVKGTTPLW